MPTIPKPEEELEKRRRELIQERETMKARAEDAVAKSVQEKQSREFYRDFNARMDARGPQAPAVRYVDAYDDPEQSIGGGQYERREAPAINDPLRDAPAYPVASTWAPDLAKPAAPEGQPMFIGQGSGGPQEDVPGLTEQDVTDLRDYRRKRDEERASLGVRQSMLSMDQTPDQAAEAIDLAERNGANPLEVRQNIQTFRQADSISRIDALREKAPKLRTWLDDRVNLEVAHDDTETLSWWESWAGTPTLEEFGGALKSGFEDKLPEQLFGLDQMLAEGNAAIYGALPDWFPYKRELMQGQVTRGEEANVERLKAAARAAANAPQGDTWFERGLYGAAQSAPATVASVIITAITKSPVAGASSMGATTAGGAFGEAGDAGITDLGDKFRYAMTQGGIETATEFIPLKFLIGDLAKDTPFAKTFFKQAAAEGISEQAATFLQDASTWLELNPDKTLGEFLAERPNAALETLVASTVMSGVQTTVGVGVQKAADGAAQSMQQRRAEQLAKTFDAMAQNAKDSKLLKRLPEKYRELVNQVTADGPLESVRVAPEGFASLAQEQGITTEQLARTFQIDPAEIVRAMEAGEDVVIRSGDYGAGIATAKKAIGVSGETIHAAFAPHMRLRAEDFTAKEREAMQAMFEAEQEARAQAQDAQQGFADAADRVRETIREQIAATGLYNAETASTQAELVGAMVTTLAERLNVDPETLRTFDIVASLKGEEDPVALAQTVMNDLANPRGFITGKDKSGARKTYSPRDIVLGYNDGDSTLDIALDLDIAEDSNQRAAVRDAASRIRLNVRRAMEAGQIERLAEVWGVTPDELQKFGGPSPRGSKGGAFEDLMGDVADIVERDNRNGHAPGLEQVVARLNARGYSTTASTLKVRLSNARNGTGEGKLSDAMRERVKALQFAKGRGAAQGKALRQEARGTFTPREDRSVIRLFESANLSTLAHEGSHWYLDTLWRMAQAPDAHPFVRQQLAAILEWQGKHPEWNAMFNPDGSFTEEGRDLQEAFAESFEAYLMEGKAPTTALRSVFASFKQWLLNIYKGIVARIGGRVRLNDEIRAVFDRMLATDEAIKAVQSGMARDSAAMAQSLLDKGVITPRQFEKTKERIQAARERAEAALTARLIEEYERSQKAWWNDDERQTRREVQSEIDERPEQRAYQHLTGIWRDTREAHVEAAFAEADAMMALAQADGYLGSSYQEAAEWVAAREKGLDLSEEARAKRAKQMGFTKRFFHETKADPADLNEGFDTTRRQAATGDSIMPLGVFVKPGQGGIGIGGTQVELLVRLGNTRTFADRAELEAHLRQDAEYAALADEVAKVNELHKADFKRLEAAWDKSKRASKEWFDLNAQINAALRAWDDATNVAGEAARVRATQVLQAEGLNSITVTKDVGSFSRAIKTTVVFDPKDLRSPNAAFDPAETNSSRLLAHSGDGFGDGFVEPRHVDLNATDESLMALRARMMEDGRIPLVLLFKTTEGRIIAFPGASGEYGMHHDFARDMLGLGNLKLQHGVWNPRKWPTLADMDKAGSIAWYDTTGTQADDGASLAHSVQPSRQLDAMGFYSAAQESAQRVPDNIWKMGWQAARNSMAKGHDGIVPRKTEIEYLGLDAMFGDTKLKGEELKSAVLEHIAAKRLSLVENFARFDPADTKIPSKRAMLEAMSPQALSSLINVDFQNRGDGRGDIVSDLGNPLYLYIQRKSEPLSSPTYYDLMQPQAGGEAKIIATGTIGDLDPIVGKMIFDANPERAARRIDKDALAEAYREGYASNLVRGAGDVRLPGEDVPLFEAVIGLPEGVPGSDYRAPITHVGGKMKGTLVTAHGEERIDDKGQRTVFVGQVQSDQGQEISAIRRAAKENKMDGPAESYAAMIADTQGIPLVSTSEWTNVAVRAMIYRAAREGFQSISFPTAETSEIIQGNDSAAQHYETNVKGALEKIARQLGGEVRKGGVGYDAELRDWATVDPDTAHALLNEVWKKLPAGLRQTLLINLPKVRRDGDTKEFYVSNGKDPRDGDAAGFPRSTFDYELREAKWNPLIASYSIWVQGAVIWEEPGAFEKMLETAGGGGAAVAAAFEKAKTIKAEAYILDITPAMRAKIVAEGFPLFHTGPKKGTTTPPANLPPMRLNLQAVREQYGEQALAEIPPEVAAFSMQATDLEQFVELARSVRKTLNTKRPKSLWKFIASPRRIGSGNDAISYRGIQDAGGEVLQMVGEKKAAPGLIADKEQDGKRARSYTLEGAAQAAWEEGYFQGQNPPDSETFLAALRDDLEGRAPRYATRDIPDLQAIENAEQWAAWFEANDVDIRADVATLREKLAVVITGETDNAIGPDEAAPFFKMPDGKALLEGLKQGPLRNRLIREETQRRMIERHGDVFRDGTIMAEAEAYARNEIQHRQLEIELEALAQATGQQAAANLAKQQAVEALRSKQVREVLNYNQWLQLERRWAKKAVEAAGKGDMAKAAEYARYRLINSHMFTEGRKLAEKVEKTVTHLRGYETKTKLARLHAAGRDYATQMQGLLSDYQFRNESRKAENKRAARAVWLQSQMQGIDPFAAYADPTKSAQEQQAAAAEAIERSASLARLAEGAEARNYKSITVEELLAVRDEADLIYRLATLKDRLIKEGERRRLSLAADDIAAEVETNQPNPKPPEPLETDIAGERIKSSLQMYFARHRTLQSLAHQFAGGRDGGVFWRYVVRPLNEAFTRLTGLRKKMGDDVAALFNVYTKAEQERFYRDRRHFKGIGRSLTTQGRLAIALNWGNEKNRQRVMDAYGWDETQVQEVLDSLDKRDWDFVQATWDYLDTWFPEANRVHEAVHGVPMTKEQPMQVATRFGVYAGGYYPIKFDASLSSKAGQRAVEAEARTQTGRVGVRTQEGFTKKRVSGKVTMPLRLSALDVIVQHLDEVAKSIATEETLFDVGRILKQKQVEDAIVGRHGRQIYNTIINQVVTAKFGMEGASGLLAHLRNGATVIGLSWKVATASLQILGASNSVVRVGGPWVAKGYARMAGGGVPIVQAASEAMQKSEFMRNRRENQSPEMASLLDAIKNKWTPDFIARVVPRELRMAHNFMVRNGFALMSNVQFVTVDLPTWWGAYYKAQNAGMDEGDAVAMADQAVIDAQGGGELHQLAAMQSGAGSKYASLLRILTNFMSYMITTYNLGVQRLRNARSAGQIFALAFDFVILAAVPVAGKMAMDLITKGVGDGDEPEEVSEAYMREQVAFLFGPFVGVSQFAGAARGDDSYGYKGPAGLAIFNEMNRLGAAVAEGKFIDDETGGIDPAFWRPANRAAGMIFHYPASQIDASIRGAQAYFNGETDNPAAIFFGPPPAN